MSGSRLIAAIEGVRRRPGLARPDDVDPRGKRVLLVYLFRALGDTLLVAPVVKALAGAGARVTVVVEPRSAEVLALVDLGGARVHATDRPLEGEFDVAVDLTYRSDADAARWMRAPIKLGWGLTEEDVRHHADRHWSRMLVKPLRPLGVKEPDFEVRFTVPKRKLPWAARAKEKVLLVPGARDENKRWRGFASVAREASARASVVVLGAPGEQALIDEIVSAAPRARSYTGSDLATLFRLVLTASAVVTNDTGPMHLAFLAKVPAVAIFTWMSPVCWGPPSPDPRFAILGASASETEVIGHLARVLRPV